ncbi:hypothetical protein BCR35DRAFT_274577 [Leucosporidium creatinivorum]|uniref:SigF-like NTF2-like domain-containing protein n=1 Tax=Leucosporidium creatinivorum TaxID=106004 RepID=A0A1Y2G153_9BASI|nr:hypothetical protein BCR35DRAFT_274577 [Leucosporidium creatinivorum]
MEDPQFDIRNVVRSITEPREADQLLANVDRYFTSDAVIVHPMLNSPSASGRAGVKAAYKMLRVLTIGNKVDFHVVALDRIVNKKNVEHTTALLDITEHLQLRFLPLPTSYNPWFHIRFLVRVDLIKCEDGLWRITKQEDNLPTDFGSTGLALPGIPLASISDAFKWCCGAGTLATSRVITALGLFK